MWGCAKPKVLTKIENLQKKAIRNVSLKKYKAHTEPIFKKLNILKLADKLSYCRSVFMHQYRNGKLPVSFTGLFSDIINTDELQTRHNDYNYNNEPAIRHNLESFPFKQIIFNWNSLNIDLKSTGDEEEFKFVVQRNHSV